MNWVDPVASCVAANPVVPVVVSVVPVVPVVVVVSVVPQLQAVVVGVVIIPTAEEVWAHVEEKQSLKSKSMLVFGLNDIVANMSKISPSISV